MLDVEILKKKIINLAIQGKLTEQLVSDGNAEMLYEDIQKYNIEQQKDGKLKKGATISDISDDEIPFEIPSNWKWVRLAEISSTNIGLTYHPNDVVEDGTIVLRSNNIQNGRFDFSELMAVSCDIRENQYIHMNDILICARNGSKNLVGKCAIYEGELGSVSFGAFMAVLRTPIFEYIYYYLNSDAFRRYFQNDDTKQINQVTQAILKKAVVPIPPADELKRIVDKLLELFVQLDNIDSLQRQYNADLELLKAKIIFAGIQGKMTEQLSEDGNAEDLYVQIQKEKTKLFKEGKIKKEKPLMEISEDEIPFEIPDNWKWVRLGIGINLLSGQDFPPEGYNSEGFGIPYMTGASNIENGKLIVNRWTQQPKTISSLGDLLLVCKGSGFGKLAINNVGNVHIARQFMAISVDEHFLELKYIQLFLVGSINVIKSNGQGLIPGIDRPSVMNMLMPLPPLAEQKRIVNAIEEVLELLDLYIGR